LRRQLDDRMSTDEDEEEEDAEENDESGIGGNFTEPAIGNKDFELNKKAKEKAILLLKQEQKEYANKAKRARESLAELERQWKREDEEQNKAWKKEDEEMMKENERARAKRKQGSETDLKFSRKKRKGEKLPEEQEGKVDRKEGDEQSIRNDNSISLFNDSRQKSLNSTNVRHTPKVSDGNTHTASVTINDKGSGKDGSDGGREKNKYQQGSERKEKDLQRKKKELDDLNQTKIRMTWLLKQVIIANGKKKRTKC